MKTGFGLILEDELGDIRFLTVNPAFAEITEIRLEDAVNKLVEDVLPERGVMAQGILKRVRENRADEPLEFHSDTLPPYTSDMA